MNIKRILQLIFQIHHIFYGYGWKLSFLPYGLFFNPEVTIKYLENGKRGNTKGLDLYHNCTLTGVY